MTNEVKTLLSHFLSCLWFLWAAQIYCSCEKGYRLNRIFCVCQNDSEFFDEKYDLFIIHCYDVFKINCKNEGVVWRQSFCIMQIFELKLLEANHSLGLAPSQLLVQVSSFYLSLERGLTLEDSLSKDWPLVENFVTIYQICWNISHSSARPTIKPWLAVTQWRVGGMLG